MSVTDKEYAILSNAVYRDENYIDPANYGFTRIASRSIDQNGTYMEAYKNKDNEVVIAFRGTDNALNKLHDAQYLNNGAIPPECTDALQFCKDMKEKCIRESMTIVGMTGHSLGGMMVQYANSRLSIEQGYQIQGVTFAPLGAGNAYPTNFEAKSITVRNYRHAGDVVPMTARQLGEDIILPSKNQAYQVQYTPNVGNEIVAHYDDSTGKKHSMIGYLVDVGQMPVRTQGQGGPAPDPKVWVEREKEIKEHIPLKNDKQDAVTEEYYKQAKSLLGKEGGWSQSMDVAIAEAMVRQGYDHQKIMDAMKSISPCVSVTSDANAQSYAEFTMKRAKAAIETNSADKTAAATQKDSQEIKSLDNAANSTKTDEILSSPLSVDKLPRNPDSKSLFNAYAKEVLEQNGQVWTADTNKQIVESMLKDGRTPQRIVEALKQSPEPIANAYYYVKEIGNTPEMQQMQKAKGIAR